MNAEQLTLDFLLIGVKIPALPRIFDRDIRAVLKHRDSPQTPNNKATNEYGKLVHLGDNLLRTLVACSLYANFPKKTLPEIKAIEATLLRPSILGPLSKRLGCHDDNPFDIDPPPSHLSDRFKAYVAGVYFDCLKDDSKTSGAGATALETWLGALFAHLGAKVTANGIVEEEQVGDKRGLDVEVVTDELVTGTSAETHGHMELGEITNDASVQILDDTSVQAGDTALVNLQNLRKHRVLDFHLQTVSEDNQWRTEVSGKYRETSFSVSILRPKKKLAEKVAAHLILRYLGFLGREELHGANAASWKNPQFGSCQMERKTESLLLSMIGTKRGGKRKKRGSEDGDKKQNKGKKKQRVYHASKHSDVGPVATLADPKLKSNTPTQSTKHQPWLPEQMDQRVRVFRQ